MSKSNDYFRYWFHRKMTMRIYLTVIATTFFMLQFGISVIASGQESSKCNPACDNLLQMVDQKGHIYVVITLNSSLKPESEMLFDDEKAARREASNQIERNFVDRLKLKIGLEVVEEGRREPEPSLLMKVGKNLLQRLIDDNEVRKIDMSRYPNSRYRRNGGSRTIESGVLKEF